MLIRASTVSHIISHISTLPLGISETCHNVNGIEPKTFMLVFVKVNYHSSTIIQRLWYGVLLWARMFHFVFVSLPRFPCSSKESLQMKSRITFIENMIAAIQTCTVVFIIED